MARVIHPTVILGAELRMLQGFIRTEDEKKYGPPQLPENVYIGPYCIIGNNATLGERVIVDAYCKIDPNASIGANTLLVYRASIGSYAEIGDDCVIGGSVAEGTIIGARCRSFGKLIHTHADSTISWDHHDPPEASPTVRDDSFIGHDSTVLGGVEIGPRSYVCSGAIVTRDVPPYYIAHGVNRLTHHRQWRGKLAHNPLFEG